MKKLAIFFAFYMSLVCLSHAQGPSWINCLSAENILDIAETESDTWIASTGGLVQYEKNNGRKTYFNRGNSEIPSNEITSIVVDIDNVVWISTSKGLASFDGLKWTRYENIWGRLIKNVDDYPLVVHSNRMSFWNGSTFDFVELPEIVQHNIIGDVAIDKTSADVWITTWTFGLFNVLQYSDGTWNIFNNQNTLLPFESPGNAISVNEEGKVLVLGSGLYSYDGSNWSDLTATLPLDSIDGALIDVVHDRSGNAFILSNNYMNDLGCQLISLDIDGAVQIERIPIDFAKRVNANFLKLSLDQETVYTGFSNVGLWQKNHNESWKKLPLNNTIFGSNNFLVVQDDEGVIWLQNSLNTGNLVNSVYQVDENGFVDVSNRYPLNHESNSDLSILNANSTKGWIVIRDSLFEGSSGNWQVADVPDLEGGVDELDSYIYFDFEGRRWLLEAYQSKIYYESSTGWEVFHYSEHGAQSGVYFSKFNHPTTNDLWLSSYNGISIYNYDEWNLIKLRDYGFNQNYATFVIDQNNIIWGISGTSFFKVTSGDSIAFEVVATSDSFNQISRFNSILCDENNVVWLGMDGVVIKVENGNDFTIFDNTNSGIPNGLINSIIQDDSGNYWIGNGQGGLSIYNPEGIQLSFIDSLHSGTIDPISNLATEQVVIFPNPVKEDFIIKAKEDQGPYSAELFGVDGRLVKKLDDFSSSLVVSVSDLNSGLIIIKVLNEKSGYHTIHRIIIE